METANMEPELGIIELINDLLAPRGEGRGRCPRIERVLRDGPATVVFWEDGGKTVVVCRECEDGRCLHRRGYEPAEGERPFERPFACAVRNDPEKALMAAILKRECRGWQDVVRPFLPEEEGDDYE